MAASDGWDYEPAAPRPDLADAVQGGDEPEAAALVLADWLDEQGDAIRARFVRLSAWVRLDPWGDDALAWERERAWLWAACSSRWQPELPAGLWWLGSARPDAAPMGLPTLVGGLLGEEVGEVFDRSGTRDISVLDRDIPSGDFAASEWLPRVAGVEVSLSEDYEAHLPSLDRLAASLPRVRRLMFRFYGTGACVLPPGFAESGAFAGLRELELDEGVSFTPFATTSRHVLTRLRLAGRTGPLGALPNLRRLRLERGAATREVLASVAAADSLEGLELVQTPNELLRQGDLGEQPALRHLLLDWQGDAPFDPAAVVSSLPAAGGLRSLRLESAANWRPIGSELAGWRGLGTLRSLLLGCGLESAKSVAALAHSPHAGGLRALRLRSRSGPPQLLQRIENGFSPGQLRELSLWSTGAFAPGTARPDLAAPASSLRELRSLAVGRCPTVPAVAAEWAERLPLEELAFVRPTGHALRRAWAERVGRSPTLRLVRVERHDFGADPASVPRGWLARGDTCVRRPG